MEKLWGVKLCFQILQLLALLKYEHQTNDMGFTQLYSKMLSSDAQASVTAASLAEQRGTL